MDKEIKSVVEKLLGFEVGDIEVEKTIDDGIFKGLAIRVQPKKKKDEGVYVYAERTINIKTI